MREENSICYMEDGNYNKQKNNKDSRKGAKLVSELIFFFF